jgi:hypothetical protein
VTDQEINRAVAESLSASFGCSVVIEKDYCNSYDAIMPLVKALKKGREDRFAEELFFEVHPDDKMRNGYLHIAYCHALITATPRQLCEAYLAVGGADA